MASNFSSQKTAGAEVVRQTFGGHLTQQGRGFYVTLELLAIAWGTANGHCGTVLPTLGEGERLTYVRRGHDFARRWMAGEDLTPADYAHVRGDGAEETLRALLVSLRVPIPHRRKLPKWQSQHLYPYVGQLVHYDAVQRRGRPEISRDSFRGGGALAHKMLRTDPDSRRLEANRRGLAALVAEEASPLGRLISALGEHDLARPPDSEFDDDDENDAIVLQTQWVDLLRSGTRNVLSRERVPRAKKVELLMHWVPFCIAMHQLARANESLGTEAEPVVVSSDPTLGRIRQHGRHTLERARAQIQESLLRTAHALEDTVEGDATETLASLRTGSRRWCEGATSFFTGTLAAVGALNAHSGRRHFALSLSMLEAVVHATLAEDERLPFDQFCTERLYGQLNLVVDDGSGALARISGQIDVGDLALNGAFVANELAALGLLHEYSDATRLVHAGAPL